MRIGSISMEMTARRMFNAGIDAGNNTMRTLATGLRINSAEDDPAGLISSEYLRGALLTLDAESRSLDRADAVASTASSALGEISDMLTEAETLAVAAANTGATTPAERAAMQDEIDSILQSVDRMSQSSFNGQRLFSGNMSLTVGSDTISFATASSRDLGLDEVASGGSASLNGGDASAAQDKIRDARSRVLGAMASIASFQKDAISPRQRAISIAAENTAAAVSVIRDTDYASATANLARQQALTSAAGRMLRITTEGNSTALTLLG